MSNKDLIITDRIGDSLYPKLIVAASPRSGTYFLSELLTQGGLVMGHECFYGIPGSGTWRNNMIGECSWLAAPFLERDKKDRVVLHLVRNPLKQITSLMRTDFFEPYKFKGNVYTQWVQLHIPDIEFYSIKDRYLVFWLRWNQWIEKHANATYRLEDIVKDPYEIFKDLKHDVGDVKLDTSKKNAHKNTVYRKLDEFKNCDHYDWLVKEMKRYKYID